MSILILATWLASLLLAIFFMPASKVCVWIMQGTILCITADYDLTPEFRQAIGVTTSPVSYTAAGFGLILPRSHARFPIDPQASSAFHSSIAYVPLWLLLLLTAIPTAWLWHRDRRLFSSPPDHLSCRGCGYDLTGNLSGVCPECGEKTARREETVESRK